jgi:hypothetical protein
MGVAGHLGAGRVHDAMPAESDTLGPPLPPGTRFALIAPGQGRPEAAQFVHKPFVAPGLPALARHIHRRRGDAALQLAPERVRWMGQTLDTVRVVAHDQTGERYRLIGHAFIGGQDWRTLASALDAQIPNAEVGA